jgi:hypothetical protein
MHGPLNVKFWEIYDDGNKTTHDDDDNKGYVE